MNLESAKELLELDSNFTLEQVKQNYHRLSLKHHPDKGGDTNNFINITQAYNFIIKFDENLIEEKGSSNSKGTNSFNSKGINSINLNDIFRTFINPTVGIFKSNVRSFFGFKKEITVNLTAKEYLEGSTKEIETIFKTHCGCEQKFCHKCRGFSFQTCNHCMGSGIIQECDNCVNGFITHTRKVTITIPKYSLKPIVLDNTVVDLKLNEKNYFVKDNKLYYKFTISLKESLIGFVKTFKDPFGFEHTVTSNDIIKQNDGYSIPNGIILLFQVIYPKKLTKSVIKQLKMLDF
jgi:hypothetical protein